MPRVVDLDEATTIKFLYGLREAVDGNPATLEDRLVDTGMLQAILESRQGPSYESRAELFADLAWSANTIGYVMGDDNPAFRGVYKKIGNAGVGSWTLIGPLPTRVDTLDLGLYDNPEWTGYESGLVVNRFGLVIAGKPAGTPVATITRFAESQTIRQLYSARQVTFGPETKQSGAMAGLQSRRFVRDTLAGEVADGIAVAKPARVFRDTSRVLIGHYYGQSEARQVVSDSGVASRVTATTNLTLSGTQTIDGVACIANDRVLATGQTLQKNNGLYLVAAGAWVRDPITLDPDLGVAFNKHVGLIVTAVEGTANKGNPYRCTVVAGGTLGTTAIPFQYDPLAFNLVEPFQSTALTPVYSDIWMITDGINPLRHNDALPGGGLTSTLVAAKEEGAVPRNSQFDGPALAFALGLLDAHDGKYPVVIASSGQGATTLANLSQGTAPYANMKAILQAEIDGAVAKFACTTVAIRFHLYHGSADATSATKATNYQGFVTALFTALKGEMATWMAANHSGVAIEWVWVVSPTARAVDASLMLSNGKFDSDTMWTKGSGWSIASGLATRTNVLAASAILQNPIIPLVPGATYDLTYDITAIPSGTITPQFTGGSTVSGTARSTTGLAFADTLVAASGNTSFQFLASSGFAGSIANVRLTRRITTPKLAYQTGGTHAAMLALATTGAFGGDPVLWGGPRYWARLDANTHPMHRENAPIGYQHSWSYQQYIRTGAVPAVMQVLSAVIDGAQIFAKILTPTLPLTLEPDVGDDGTLGFGFVDSTESAYCRHAVIGPDPDEVTIFLNRQPTGANPVLLIAGAVSTATAGAKLGMRTPLCDSTPFFCPVTGRALPQRPAHQAIAVTS